MNAMKDKARELLMEMDFQPHDCIYEIEEAIQDKGFNVRMGEGASKNCIILKDYDFVIKWTSYPDMGRPDPTVQEANIYNRACDSGVGGFFPKTVYLGTYKGCPMVAQEKIDFSAQRVPRDRIDDYIRITRTVNRSTVKKMQTCFNKACGKRGYSRILDKMWASMVVSLYGKRAAKALCDFLIRENINDLHESNIGYKNNRPVILDFCGYDG